MKSVYERADNLLKQVDDLDYREHDLLTGFSQLAFYRRLTYCRAYGFRVYNRDGDIVKETSSALWAVEAYDRIEA